MRSRRRLAKWGIAIFLALIAVGVTIIVTDPQRRVAIELYESVLANMRRDEVVGLISVRGLSIDTSSDSPSIRCRVDDRFVVVVVVDETGQVYSKRLSEVRSP